MASVSSWDAMAALPCQPFYREEADLCRRRSHTWPPTTMPTVTQSCRKQKASSVTHLPISLDLTFLQKPEEEDYTGDLWGNKAF